MIARHDRLGAVCALILTLLALPSVAADYRIGVLAKNGAAQAIAQWQATADYLTAALPADRFSIQPLDFPEVFPAIESARVDFFLVNSSMFVTAQRRFAATPIVTLINARQGQALNRVGAVIFTYLDRDDLNGLTDLVGKNFIAVAPTGFGGWQMAHKELLDAGVDPHRDFATLSFGGNHDNVVYAVQNGEADAGTVRTDALERLAAAGDIAMDEFKILGAKAVTDFPFVLSTRLYPEWPLAKVAQTPDTAAQAVAKALIAMPADSAAARAAKIIGWSAPLDYGPVAELQRSLGLVDQDP